MKISISTSITSETIQVSAPPEPDSGIILKEDESAVLLENGSNILKEN
jgi:hypothetical protein